MCLLELPPSKEDEEGLCESFTKLWGKFVRFTFKEVLRPTTFEDEIESSKGNETISSKWFWFVLDVTDLVEVVVLGFIPGTAVVVDTGNDSSVFFFFGIAPVLLFGALFVSWDVFADESNCKFVTVEEEVDSDEITAVVDIFLSFVSLDSTLLDGAKPAAVDDSGLDFEKLFPAFEYFKFDKLCFDECWGEMGFSLSWNFLFCWPPDLLLLLTVLLSPWTELLSLLRLSREEGWLDW